MDRNALLIYLRDLRDLEVAKWKINSIYNQEYNAYKNDDDYYKKTNYEEVWDNDAPKFLLGAILCAILAFVFFKVGHWGVAKVGGNNILEAIGYAILELEIIEFILGYGGYLVAIILAIVSIVLICISIHAEKDYVARKKEVKLHNRQEDERVKDFPVLRQQNQQQWENESVLISSEYNKVVNMLTKAYSINILPNQYHNLASVYYIYDYMSSSRASLEDTLIHEHMENGIQRILKKLDVIIRQNEEIILQNRVIESNTREIAGSNNKILESCRRNESNTENAAYYAKIAASNTEATAFFALANYLKN